MNAKCLFIVSACLVAICGQVQAADTPTTAPATVKPAPAPITVLATVGNVKITSDRIDAPLKSLPAGFPPERISMIREKILGDLITAELVHSFLETRKAPFDQKAYDELKGKLKTLATERGVAMDQLMAMAGLTEQRLRDQVRLKAMADKETAKEKVDAFIKANPTYFNGTKVTASHILMMCEPAASTKDQKAAVAKLEKIAADIKAGTITFEKAAEANSDCPSKAKGGDLGEFDVIGDPTRGVMDPQFCFKAYSLKVGETSGIVRTPFGFHIIKLTKRTDGSAKPGPEAEETAKNCLISSLQGEIFNQVLAACPIVINETK